MAARISEYSKKRGRGHSFLPDLDEWKKACRLCLFDTQLIKHFDISKETFYVFLDKQRYEEEQGRKADYLDAYKNEKNKTRNFVNEKLLEQVENNEIAAIIFAAKTYGGLLETKDMKHIELKKKEVALKTRAYLTDLAHKFNLNFEELKEFTAQHFKNVNLGD